MVIINNNTKTKNYLQIFILKLNFMMLKVEIFDNLLSGQNFMKHLYTILLTLCCAAFLNAETYKYHTIKDGETLWRISKNYNVTMDKLCEVNKIKDATKVKQGTTLKIPVENQSAAAKQTPPVDTVKKPADKPAAQISKPTETKAAAASSKSTSKGNTKAIDLQIPMVGNVKPFITPNTKGIIIFQNESKSKNVVSSDAGTISYVNDLPGYGLSVLIKHPNNVVSVYSGFSGVTVKQGDSVKRGQLIGNAGRLAKYDKVGILFSVQKNQEYLKYDVGIGKFVE